MSKLITRLDRLNEQLEKLLSLLSAYTTEQLQEKPTPESWSAIQVIQHVMLAEQLSVGYVRKKMQFPQGLKKSSLENWIRLQLLRFFMNAPLKFKAPAIVAEPKFSNDVDFGILAEKWRAIRTDLRKLLDEFPPELEGTNIYKHAMAGRLSLNGMLEFFEGHFSRHRKQIFNALKAVGAEELS